MPRFPENDHQESFDRLADPSGLIEGESVVRLNSKPEYKNIAFHVHEDRTYVACNDAWDDDPERVRLYRVERGDIIRACQETLALLGVYEVPRPDWDVELTLTCRVPFGFSNKEGIESYVDRVRDSFRGATLLRADEELSWAVRDVQVETKAKEYVGG